MPLSRLSLARRISRCASALYRDEANSANVATMSSLGEMWQNLPFESFPMLWLVLLRGGAWSA